MLNFIAIIAGVMIGTLLAGVVTFVVMLYTPALWLVHEEDRENEYGDH